MKEFWNKEFFQSINIIEDVDKKGGYMVKENRDFVLSFRIGPSEMLRTTRQCMKRKISVSDYLREILNEDTTSGKVSNEKK